MWFEMKLEVKTEEKKVESMRIHITHKAKVVVNPGASNPHEVIVKKKAVESVKVIPAVVDGKYSHNFKFANLMNETNIFRSTEA